jgi:hypothetical protein
LIKPFCIKRKSANLTGDLKPLILRVAIIAAHIVVETTSTIAEKGRKAPNLGPILQKDVRKPNICT